MPIGPDDVVSEQRAADYLYGLAAEEFVVARDQLVRALRAGGQRDLANQVKTLRRPTVIAAELNRVLRDSPEQLEEVIEAAQALSQGHHRLLAGEAVDLAELQAAHRSAARALAQRARRHDAEIEASLEAASVDEAFHQPLRIATFAVEPTPARGFDLLTVAPTSRRPLSRSATVTSLDSRRPATVDRLDEPGSPEADSVQPVREPVSSAGPVPSPTSRHREEAAQAAVTMAERRLSAARAAAAKAASRVAEMESRLSEVRRHHETANQRLTAAEAAAARAHGELADIRRPGR